VSQLEGVVETDRDFTFEEADAATLAELGIDPAEQAPAPPEEAEQADDKPKRTRRSTKSTAADGGSAPARRTRSKKADAIATPAETDDKPKRTRRTTKAAGEAEAAPADEKPKPRSRARKPDSGSAGASRAARTADGEEADGEPQGIWGRFRSARKPPTASS